MDLGISRKYLLLICHNWNWYCEINGSINFPRLLVCNPPLGQAGEGGELIDFLIDFPHFFAFWICEFLCMVVVNTKTIEFKWGYLEIPGRGNRFACLWFVLYWLIVSFADHKQCNGLGITAIDMTSTMQGLANAGHIKGCLRKFWNGCK